MGFSIIEVNPANPHWEITEFYNVIIKLNSLETKKIHCGFLVIMLGNHRIPPSDYLNNQHENCKKPIMDLNGLQIGR